MGKSSPPLSLSALQLIEGEEFNNFCANSIDLIADIYEEADTEERTSLDLGNVAEQEFHKNQTLILYQLVLLEKTGASKEDIISGLNHFVSFFDAHKTLFGRMKELAKTL